jgi:hypothetical protein
MINFFSVNTHYYFVDLPDMDTPAFLDRSKPPGKA